MKQNIGTSVLQPKNFVFDKDGVFIFSEKINYAILAYYGQVLSLGDLLPEEWYYEIFETSFSIGFEKLIKKYGLKKPDQADYDRAQPLLLKVLEARKSAGLFPGMKSVFTGMKHLGATLSINTSAPLPLLKASVPFQTLQLFSAIAAGKEQGIEGGFNKDDYPPGMEIIESPNKKEKFHALGDALGVKICNTFFFTDTVGDIEDALLAGLPPKNILHVMWGFHSEPFRRQWAEKKAREGWSFAEDIAHVRSVHQPYDIIDIVAQQLQLVE